MVEIFASFARHSNPFSTKHFIKWLSYAVISRHAAVISLHAFLKVTSLWHHGFLIFLHTLFNRRKQHCRVISYTLLSYLYFLTAVKITKDIAP